MDKLLQRGRVLIYLFRRSFPGRDIGDKKEEQSRDRSSFVVEVVLREGPEPTSHNRVTHGGRKSPESGRNAVRKRTKNVPEWPCGPVSDGKYCG